MSVKRSPTKSQPLLKAPIAKIHCNSDPALNTAGVTDSEDACISITKRQKRSYCERVDQPEASVIEIKSMFLEFQEQQDKRLELINNALSTIVSQNQEIRKSMEAISSQHEDLIHKINYLEQENGEYKKRVANLENMLGHIEKTARCSTIEIRSIPKQDGENKQTITKIVQDIGLTLKLSPSIQESEIRDIYRNKSQAIVVDFTTTRRKETVISNYITLNKTRRERKEAQFNSKDIKLPGATNPVFISEYLTTKARRLFFVAREAVKNRKLNAAWTSFGKVYVRREEGATPVVVQEESDFTSLIM